MIKLGIIGCGVIGQTHIQTAAVLPGVSIVALADLREAVVREVAAKFNVPQTYNTAAALLANTQVDAVIIALPTAGRVQVVLQALAAGKHLLVEKPIGMNADEVRQMIAARGDRIAGCCQSRMRLTTGARTATEFIAQGSLGDLRVIRCRAWAAAGPPPPQLPPVWRLNKQLNGGGILVNWGCYDLDYLLGLTGWRLQPRHVLAQTWQVPPAYVSNVAPGSDAETHGAALITCADGAIISFERGEYMPATTEQAWQIIGTKGSLQLVMPPGPQKLVFDEAVTAKGVVSRTLWEGNDDWNNCHRNLVADFVSAVRDHRQPLASLEQALIVQQLLDAIYESAATGAPVEIK